MFCVDIKQMQSVVNSAKDRLHLNFFSHIIVWRRIFTLDSIIDISLLIHKYFLDGLGFGICGHLKLGVTTAEG
jgi:hypothetical protein